VLHRTTFFVGGRLDLGDLDSPVPDISWFRRDGAVMEDDDWRADTVTVHLSGQSLRARLPHGERITDDSYLIVLHTGAADTSVVLPGAPWGRLYAPLLDTAAEDLGGFPQVEESPPRATLRAGDVLPVTGHTLRLLRVLG
jgi:isoamylase